MTRPSPTLLPRHALIKTSEVDQPVLNFHPLLGVVQRLRFAMILSLLPNRRFSRLLEIGYGSGILQPELARRCDSLYGVDIHLYAAQVRGQLRDHHVDTDLVQGSGTALPFGDRVFDCIVAMSCLEYMDPLGRVVQEVKRVLAPKGCFVFVTPGNSPLIDLGHDLLTGRRVREHYGDRRDSLLSLFKSSFVVEQELARPALGGKLLTLYRGLRLTVP